MAEEATPHRGLRCVEEAEQGALACAAGTTVKEFESADGLRIEDHRLGCTTGGESLDLRERAALGFLQVGEDCAGG